MKKNLIIFIICCLWGSISLYAQQTSRPYGEDPAGWKYHGGDEFNEGKVDPLKWGVYRTVKEEDSYMMSDHHLVSYFSTANVIFETDKSTGEKVCRLASTIATDNNKHPIWNGVVQTDRTAWYTGGLSSRDSKDKTYYPLYARFEIRAKTGYEIGFWPALWLRHFKGASRAELDILEFFAKGKPDEPTVRQSTHMFGNYDKDPQKNVKAERVGKKDVKISGDKPGEGYHIYGVQIEKDPLEEGHAIITYLLDGKETHSIYTKNLDKEKWKGIYGNFLKVDENRAWDIALNNTVGGKHDDVGYPADDATPHNLTIDWVRVYVPTGETIVRDHPPFLIGSAVSSVGWTLENAVEMKKEGDTYTWIGNLEKGEFKFLSLKDKWQPAYVASSKMKVITSGSKYDLVYDTAQNTGDNFVIQEGGEYTIVVDLKNKTMIATKNKEVIPVKPLYLIGSATNSNWNPAQAIEMKADGDIYTWTGNFKKGEFKFLTSKTQWTPTYLASSYKENVISGHKHKLVYATNTNEDYQFSIQEGGEYTIVVDLTNKTLMATKISNKSPVYILGNAISSVGWDNKKALKMEQPDASKAIYTWDGQLGSGHFKFITELGTWESITSRKSENENVLSGYKHSVTNERQDGNVFNVTVAGNYTVTLNMEDNTMTVVKKDGVAMPIYLLGDAILGAGWNNRAGIEMEQTATGVYTWTGFIDKGYFKFISESGTWHSIVPSKLANETLQSGVAAEVSNDLGGDYKFAVTERGTYSLSLDFTNKTLIATQISKKAPIYILGGAMGFVGWDNKKALEMEQPDASKAIYTWTGTLYGNQQFKFITELGTWKSIIPTQPRNENILSSYPHSVTDKWHGDYRFNVTVAGNYTVTLNMEDNRMTVVKDDTAMPIYLLGDAIPDAAAWNNRAGIKMEQTATGVYTWTGIIDKGHFKFISQLGTWHSILPSKLANETLQSGVAAEISNDFRGDYKFAVTERGTYSLSLDLTNKTLIATQISKKAPVYILGTAISGVVWDNKKALEMGQSDVSKAIYTWTGLLGSGQFKFITKLGTWKSIIPTQRRQNVQPNAFPYEVTDKWLGDNQFNVTVVGKYTITLDMETNTMKAELATDITNLGIESDKGDVVIIAMQGGVSINILSKTMVDQAELFDLHGKVVASSKNNLHSFSLGNNVSSGIYVVKLLYDGKVVTKKVVIK